MFIREGQVVNAGDPLLRLDDTRFASNVGETEADRLALLSRIERLNAEINGQELVLSEEITTQAPKIAAGEKELYNSRRQQLHNEISGLEEQLIQRQQELRDFSAKEIQFRNSLGLLQQEIKMSEPLIAEGAISKVEVLRLRRAEVETRGQLDSIKLSIPRAESAIKESENKIEETRSRYKSEALSQLSEAQTSLNKIEATGKALEDRVNRTLVVSPVRGIVQQVLVNTIGGVIQPGSDLVEIVPLDDKLLVEAKIRPQDIAFLHPGQDRHHKINGLRLHHLWWPKRSIGTNQPDTVTDKEGTAFILFAYGLIRII
nr:HlyD family type I secretion periplasmic adaptor subunit [Pectobacterium brasiliense]